jgi:hypothetical protein
LPAPKPDLNKLDKIMALDGIGKVEGNPLLDPLFLPAAQADERERIRNHIRLWRETSSPFSTEYDRIQLTVNGKKESFPTWKVVELQEQIAYEALQRGANVREAAAMSHLDISEVEAVAARHDMHL